ncbi:hypothetical protein E1A91_A13G238700v1 [Gossypium mustelinum]|uniref:Uncharacterized protein n=1 Tax=Gossypium mustelinum TaxID=34275 RepID=A0A5D2WLR0_GOSMU|nr:hypothetical protein E1A91_A13G238700v1 [Gossypium mustelinum]
MCSFIGEGGPRPLTVVKRESNGVRGTWRQAERRLQRRGWRAALVKLNEARVCWLKNFRISWVRV